VKDEQLETTPLDPMMIELPIGKTVESRQIAVLIFEGSGKSSENLMIAAMVVNHGMWSGTWAPPLNLFVAP
jgi:hypothetical protein